MCDVVAERSASGLLSPTPTANEFLGVLQQGDGGRATWADEFYGENHPQNGWIDQFGRERVPEDWAAEFADRAVETHLNGGSDQGYQFQPDNPFLSVWPRSFD